MRPPLSLAQTSPTVTVFLPTYNRPEMFRRALSSILEQTFQNFVVHILDNGSSPPIRIPAFCENDPRLQILRIEDNNERYALIFREAHRLSTKYCTYLCDDDAWAPEKLEKQVALMEKRADVLACFTWASLLNDEGQTFIPPSHITRYAIIFNQPNRTQAAWVRTFFEQGNCLCQPSALIRSDWMPRIFPHNPFRYLGDLWMWAHLIGHGNIHLLEEPLTRFRISLDGQTESSGLDKGGKSDQYQYESGQILRILAGHHPDLLKAAFEMPLSASDHDLHVKIFERALAIGKEHSGHRRFATEYAQSLFEQYQVKDIPALTGYWSAAFDKAATGSCYA